MSIIRPIIEPVVGPVALGPLEGGPGEGRRWSPAELFAGGEQGAWYDPSDMSTMFQDAAGTLPVTASGQPVGLILDKSGRGNHAFQATAAARPVYTEADGLKSLLFDGIDDSMETAQADFTGTDKVSIFVGSRHLRSNALSEVVALSADPVNSSGIFGVVCPTADAAIGVRGRGTTGGLISSSTTGNYFPAPYSAAISAAVDIPSAIRIVRVNGMLVAAGAGTLGTGNFGAYPMYVGARGGVSARFYGHLFEMVVRGAPSSDSEVSRSERYVAGKSGVTLSL